MSLKATINPLYCTNCCFLSLLSLFIYIKRVLLKGMGAMSLK